MWCGCANEFGAAPNTNVCPVCLGMPGVLPVANDEALRLTALTGHAQRRPEEVAEMRHRLRLEALFGGSVAVRWSG